MTNAINDLGATQEEDSQIKTIGCTCDLGSGYRGGSRCYRCDGSGSLLCIGGSVFSNTRDGYKKALKLVRGGAVKAETK